MQSLEGRPLSALWVPSAASPAGFLAVPEDGAPPGDEGAFLHRPERVLAALRPTDRARCERLLRGEDSSLAGDDLPVPPGAGRPRWIRLRSFPLPGVAPCAPGAVLVEDVGRAHERESLVRDLHAQLRTLLLEVVLSEEMERRRLAQDLHDTIQQTLTLARIRLETLVRGACGEDHAQGLAQVRELVAEASRCVMTHTFDLSPPVLHDLGVVAAIGWLAEDLGHRHGLEFACRVNTPLRTLGGRADVLLYRSVRELLLNVVKHARATHADVELALREGDLEVVVSDDGRGFDASLLERGAEDAYGLFSLRERLAYLGWGFALESAPGHGTVARIRIPDAATRVQRETVP
jgi:signal transduction histidine kinase